MAAIVGWLVYAPEGNEHDYYLFANRDEADSRQAMFDEDDPDHEHAICPLVCQAVADGPWSNILQDLRNAYEITDEAACDKFKVDDPQNGMRVSWYFKDEVAYAKEWGDGATAREMAAHSGILMLGPDQDTGRCHDFDDFVVVVDRYPTEKCWPITSWIALCRLLAMEDLVEVFADN